MSTKLDRDEAAVRYVPCEGCLEVFTSHPSAWLHSGPSGECRAPETVPHLVRMQDGKRWGWDHIGPEPVYPDWRSDDPSPDLGPSWYTPPVYAAPVVSGEFREILDAYRAASTPHVSTPHESALATARAASRYFHAQLDAK